MDEPSGHDGETLAQAVDRLGDDLEDPFDRHRGARGRVGWKDLPHAVTNLPVTLARVRPWLAGHVLMWAGLALLLVVVAASVLAMLAAR